MLEREKRYTEPAGKKKWSDGGQTVLSCLNRQIRPVDPPGHLYEPAQEKDLSAPYAGRKGLFVYRKDVAQASVNTLAMIFQPSGPFFRAWKST